MDVSFSTAQEVGEYPKMNKNTLDRACALRKRLTLTTVGVNWFKNPN